MDEIQYKRELNHSYMVLRCTEKGISDGYAYRTMEQNRIGRLLECRLRQIDGETYLYYDISSRQPLSRLFESKKLGLSDLHHIVCRVFAMQQDLEEYLLDGQGLMLEAETIFADVETEELYFCFVPATQKTEGCYTGLADFFLEHVDHGQEHAVNAAYRFYKMSKSEYFVLSAFLPFLEKEMEQTETPVYEAPCESAPVRETDSCDEPLEEEKPKKRGWLFGLLRQRKWREPAFLRPKEENAEVVWNSGAEPADWDQTGETVYFADLDSRPKSSRGRPCLTQEDGERQFFLEDLPLTVGKLKGRVSLLLSDRSVSRMHARMEASEEGICVRDLNSRNGTLVNERKLSPNESVLLKDGDEIRFGRERFRFGFLDSKAIK